MDAEKSKDVTPGGKKVENVMFNLWYDWLMVCLSFISFLFFDDLIMINITSCISKFISFVYQLILINYKFKYIMHYFWVHFISIN